MAVCAFLCVAVFFTIAVLIRSDRPVPRHLYVLELREKLSRRELENESGVDSQIRSAA